MSRKWNDSNALIQMKDINGSGKIEIVGKILVRLGSSEQKLEQMDKIVECVINGGKNIVKIMRNPALKTLVQAITVYAYKGEKVKQSLRRDGSFLNIIFKKNCVLSHIVTEVNTEMSNLVDNLDGATYEIIQLNKCLPESLEEDYMSNVSQGFYPHENQNPSQETTPNESVNEEETKDIQIFTDG
ncbi:hypothetical protein F2P81_019171 [Scophthalmus maximus]|uniref:Uncharacterized protein n=1 Tax=Scophthalmus maximus TaxID=52904 RepID=A0A6A4SB91_SCOMX|nr:hypothetical protein F2P81_019171 [Scophthalmus maximus]